MSLIQEALKRQQMEQEGKIPSPPGGDTPKPTAPPEATDIGGEQFILPSLAAESVESASPPPETGKKSPLKRSVAPAPAAPSPAAPAGESVVTAAPEPEPERKRVSAAASNESPEEQNKTRVLPALAGVALLLLLLVAGLAWAVIYGLENFAGITMPWSEPKSVVADQPEPEAPTEPTDAVASKDEPVTDAGTVVVKNDEQTEVDATHKKPTIGSVVRETVAAANAVTEHTEEVIEAAVAVNTVSEKPLTPEAGSGGATKPSAVVTVEPPPVEPVAAPVVPVKWPDITISGVVGRGAKGAVIVGGEVYGVNETVNGVRIVAIKSQGALLEYRGETRLGKVGQPLSLTN